MGNCEKYQEKLSESLDDGYIDNLPKETKDHLLICSECKRFYELLKEQSTQLQNLPNIEIGKISKEKLSVLKKIWTTKISVPFPAAAILVLVFGWYWFVDNNSQVQTEINDLKQQDSDVQIVLFLNFYPQTAVLVDSKN